MIILHFGLCGLRFKRASLFGQMGQFPVTSVAFLFGQMFVIGGRPDGIFREAIMGLSKDPEWLVKNAPQVRLECKRARVKVRAQMEAEYRGYIERAWSRVSVSEDENGKLKNEVLSLHRAIKSLNGAGVGK